MFVCVCVCVRGGAQCSGICVPGAACCTHALLRRGAVRSEEHIPRRLAARREVALVHVPAGYVVWRRRVVHPEKRRLRNHVCAPRYCSEQRPVAVRLCVRPTCVCACARARGARASAARRANTHLHERPARLPDSPPSSGSAGFPGTPLPLWGIPCACGGAHARTHAPAVAGKPTSVKSTGLESRPAPVRQDRIAP